MTTVPSPLDEAWDVIVIGAGAAGLIAAETAAARGRKTLLLEKNRRPGVKILISGGTRCNLTQATDKRGIVQAYREQGSFLHSALSRLGPNDLVKLVEDEGVLTKREDTGKIFPVSDRALDVLNAFVQRLERSGATLMLEQSVERIELREDQFGSISGRSDPELQTIVDPEHAPERTTGLSSAGSAKFAREDVSGQRPIANAESSSPKILPSCGGERFIVVVGDRQLRATSVLITTGGKSYPGCGTVGDGYAWAAGFGHRIVPPRPALVPLTTNEPWVLKLSGLTLPDVTLRVSDKGRQAGDEGGGKKAKRKSPWLDERRGSLLFTHFGLSGPVVLDISRAFTALADITSVPLVIDFVPNVRSEELDAGIREACAAAGKKQVGGVLQPWIPHRLAEALFELAGVSPELKSAELSKAARANLVRMMKEVRIPITGTRGFAKAEVTAGGVDLAEVDSRTMQSKLVPGLFFAGEVLDLDGPIGGYNFQAAFSTGMLAGEHV